MRDLVHHSDLHTLSFRFSGCRSKTTPGNVKTEPSRPCRTLECPGPECVFIVCARCRNQLPRGTDLTACEMREGEKKLQSVRSQRNVALMPLSWCHWRAPLGASIHFAKQKGKTNKLKDATKHTTQWRTWQQDQMIFCGLIWTGFIFHTCCFLIDF